MAFVVALDLLGVNGSIDLDDELALNAQEIDAEGADGLLAAELEPKLLSAHRLPKYLFARRWLFAEIPGHGYHSSVHVWRYTQAIKHSYHPYVDRRKQRML